MLPNYMDGARFIDENGEVDRSKWPRDPSVYEPSDKFVQRFKELAGIINEGDITGAIRYGDLYPARQDCVSFCNDLGGVGVFVICGANTLVLESIEVEREEYAFVTLWAHVHDREAAWATGRWTGQQLDVIDSMEPEETWTD